MLLYLDIQMKLTTFQENVSYQNSHKEKHRCEVLNLLQKEIPSVCEKVKKCQSLSSVQVFATPWTVVPQSPLSMEFSRQAYWSGQPFPSPRDLPCQESNPGLLHCRRILYCLSHQGSPSKGKSAPKENARPRWVHWYITANILGRKSANSHNLFQRIQRERRPGSCFIMPARS